MKWTKPYYGVSHLQTTDDRNVWGTIVEYETFTEAAIVRLTRSTTNAPDLFRTPDEAKDWVESRLLIEGHRF